MQQMIQNKAGFKERNIKQGCSLVDIGTDNNEEKLKRVGTQVPKDKKQWRNKRTAQITLFRRESNVHANN